MREQLNSPKRILKKQTTTLQQKFISYLICLKNNLPIPRHFGDEICQHTNSTKTCKY